MLFVQFDKTTIINSSVVQELANTGPVEVAIDGTFTVENSTGMLFLMMFMTGGDGQRLLSRGTRNKQVYQKARFRTNASSHSLS